MTRLESLKSVQSFFLSLRFSVSNSAQQYQELIFLPWLHFSSELTGKGIHQGEAISEGISQISFTCFFRLPLHFGGAGGLLSGMNLLLSKHADVFSPVSMFSELSTPYKELLLLIIEVYQAEECQPTKRSLYFWNFSEGVHLTQYNHFF